MIPQNPMSTKMRTDYVIIRSMVLIGSQVVTTKIMVVFWLMKVRLGLDYPSGLVFVCPIFTCVFLIFYCFFLSGIG